MTVRRVFRAALAAVCFLMPAVERRATAAAPGVLVLFNHDAGAGALTQFEPPITADQLYCRCG